MGIYMNGKTISINRSWWNSITPASTRKYKHQYVHFRSELSILIEQENVRHKDRIEYSFQNSTRTTLNLLGNIYHGFVQWFPCGEEISGTAGEAAAGGGAADAGGRVPPPLLFDGPPLPRFDGSPLSWGTPFPWRDML